jgi:DNA (cytosine-5)-methyltransferase 1
MKTVDLFSGCGGMSLGFQNAGFDIVAAYDNWDLANAVYSANFDHEVHSLDLSQPQACAKHIKRQYTPKAIIGGPPCQDFSIAGKRKEQHRANLTVSFAQIVCAVRPRLVVMENVYSIEDSASLKRAVALFKKHDYGITTRVIDASLTGVPQRRRRFFLIGLAGGPDDFFGSALDSGLAKRPMTVREYFGKRLNISYYYAHPRNYKRRGIFSVDEPSSTIRRVNRPIPANYKKHPADKVGVFKGLRPLTTTERSRIQTFPGSFRFQGTPSQIEHLIGNAVPVSLAEYVASQIKKTLRKENK